MQGSGYGILGAKRGRITCNKVPINGWRSLLTDDKIAISRE